jgi:hypothetical protein
MKTLHMTLLSMSVLLLSSAVQANGDDVREVKAQDLTLKVPAAWKQQQPSNNLRLAQFVIPAAEGDEEEGELVLFPPFGGTIPQNIQRWIDQFQEEDRKLKMTQGTSPQGKYVFVDLIGTYNKPDGPPILRKTKPAPGYRMLAVILTPEGGGNYFLKVTGPEKTVTEALDAFRDSYGADTDTEEEYKLN